MDAIVSVKPVVLGAPDRGTDLEVRVSAPVTGDGLPVVVFSHGFGQSMDAYAPLADHWASNGFVVLQPTHLDSRRLALPPDDPRQPRIWRFRIEDQKRVLDHLDELVAAVPGLAGRVDATRIATAGHSWGAQTAGTLLGARVDGEDDDFSDPRISAGVLMATAGTGGDDLSPFAAEHFPFMNPLFDAMTTPALVVWGDRDDSPLSVRGPDWTTDAYTLSPGRKSLLTVFGGEHSLGGIVGHEIAETTDEDPERVVLIQRVTTAYLRSELKVEDEGWTAVRAEDLPGGRLESRC